MLLALFPLVLLTNASADELELTVKNAGCFALYHDMANIDNRFVFIEYDNQSNGRTEALIDLDPGPDICKLAKEKLKPGQLVHVKFIKEYSFSGGQYFHKIYGIEIIRGKNHIKKSGSP